MRWSNSFSVPLQFTAINIPSHCICQPIHHHHLHISHYHPQGPTGIFTTGSGYSLEGDHGVVEQHTFLVASCVERGEEVEQLWDAVDEQVLAPF